MEFLGVLHTLAVSAIWSSNTRSLNRSILHTGKTLMTPSGPHSVQQSQPSNEPGSVKPHILLTCVCGKIFTSKDLEERVLSDSSNINPGHVIITIKAWKGLATSKAVLQGLHGVLCIILSLEPLHRTIPGRDLAQPHSPEKQRDCEQHACHLNGGHLPKYGRRALPSNPVGCV